MAYLRCTQCGAKALVAASQCPKCAHPFHLLDGRGERAKLKKCRSCGIMHRVDTHCHWCGEVKGFSLPRVSSAAWRSAAAVALTLTAAGGVWQYAPALRDLALEARSGATTAVAVANTTPQDNRTVATAAGLTSAATPLLADSSAALSQSTAPAADSIAAAGFTAQAATPMAPAADGITWTPAVARTWVNVRSDASRGGEVVGVIKPASRAMLGTDRAGWRQVRSPDVSGWVDPRLFEADSLRTRGE
ncbi:SH3 domain-containing protein [Gemmatimonas sp.]|jgi:hypothetical protein|uniref:SH3 domain-containing protein n=1 Tax=Gemmatimonas sp. TaxID=1962908 RepID=UPI0022C70524|nr:SH3 domain-containing protein [Gemmatimonas sp.]MCZ8203601.1 SH3 domain-containing protein [Gemmatimonas sp.]